MSPFEIFQRHFSTDLPFLHPPSFLQPLQERSASGFAPTKEAKELPQYESPASSTLIKLALLCLTARFHPQLAAHHSPATSSQPTNPVVASENYAAALKARLAGSSGDLVSLPSLERIQALLMLGLHEWGMCRGITAWLYVGVAVRMSQAMGLQFEVELDDEPLALSSAMSNEAQYLGVRPKRHIAQRRATLAAEDFVQQEIRRRTFWSCFLMDRYLSSGKYRPQMVNVKDLRIQLPSSDRAFLFGERVHTLLLGEESQGNQPRHERPQTGRTVDSSIVSEEGSLCDPTTNEVPRGRDRDNHIGEQGSRARGDDARWEVGPTEGCLSRVVRIVEIWGRIAKWSCAGGRRNESYPPWDTKSMYHDLRSLLSQYHDALPRDLIFSHENLYAHITSRTSTNYTVLHVIYFLCLIVLNREYVPFIPIRCSKPEGPLDPPLFTPPEKFGMPRGWWEQSARECFKSARDIIELVRVCQDWSVPVETPMVGFAIYTVAFSGVYCVNFPQMDPEGYLSAGVTYSAARHGDRPARVGGAEEATRAVEMIAHMRSRLKMADGWWRIVTRMHPYFRRMKQDYYRNTKALASTTSDSDGSPARSRHLSLREGGGGGGLEEYKLLEKTLKDFGSLQEDDIDVQSIDEPRTSPADVGSPSDSGSITVKSEAMEGVEATPDPGVRGSSGDGWIAINSVAANEAPCHPVGDTPVTGISTAVPSLPANSAYADGVVPHPSYSTRLDQPNPMPYPPPVLSSSQSTPTASLNSPMQRSDASSYQSHLRYSNIGSPQQGYGHAGVQMYLPDGPGHHAAPNGAALPSAPAWNPTTKEDWLNNLNTQLGGDDVAAFVEGSSWEEWPSSSSGTGGWLQTVWGVGPADTMGPR
ncbi:MAG: hypothetical protein M1833_005495 [Piccolia ochrophora]|nr:MAG: hypothetical protein M1833_005495 [Piccolia ochrophora]